MKLERGCLKAVVGSRDFGEFGEAGAKVIKLTNYFSLVTRGVKGIDI